VTTNRYRFIHWIPLSLLAYTDTVAVTLKEIHKLVFTLSAAIVMHTFPCRCPNSYSGTTHMATVEMYFSILQIFPQQFSVFSLKLSQKSDHKTQGLICAALFEEIDRKSKIK
jgi:hypothetical protein